MKALRYLLIVVAMISFLGVNAQGLAQRPEIKMRSTSGMVGSGSTLPSAAVHGTYVTGTAIGTYTPANATNGPARAKMVGEDEGFEDEDDPDAPANPFPLGDAALPLALLALAYVCVRAFLKRKRACGNGE